MLYVAYLLAVAAVALVYVIYDVVREQMDKEKQRRRIIGYHVATECSFTKRGKEQHWHVVGPEKLMVPGETVKVRKKDGSEASILLGEVVERFMYAGSKVAVCKIDKSDWRDSRGRLTKRPNKKLRRYGRAGENYRPKPRSRKPISDEELDNYEPREKPPRTTNPRSGERVVHDSSTVISAGAEDHKHQFTDWFGAGAESSYRRYRLCLYCKHYEFE